MDPANPKSCVWSFGIILLELCLVRNEGSNDAWDEQCLSNWSRVNAFTGSSKSPHRCPLVFDVWNWTFPVPSISFFVRMVWTKTSAWTTVPRNTSYLWLKNVWMCMLETGQCSDSDQTEFFCSNSHQPHPLSMSRPTFVQLLEALDGKRYSSPIQRSLQLTLFNGVTSVLDHNLDLSDFKVLDSECASLNVLERSCLSLRSTWLARPLRCRTIDQVYYLWKLAGGDLITVLKSAGLIKISASISKISKYERRTVHSIDWCANAEFSTRFVTDHGDVHGLQRDVNTLFDDTSFKLSLEELEKRFTKIPIELLYPLLEGG